jgi:transcription initiation factor TFIID subunit TAF12
LSQLGEDVVDDVVELACRLAKHRGSRTLERNDIKFGFEKRFKLKIPSKVSSTKEFGLSVLPQLQVSTQNYKTQLQLVKKEIERNAAL